MTGVVVLGRGRLGRSLSAAFARAGLAHELCAARRLEASAPAISRADTILLAVPDDVISDVAGRLTAALAPMHTPAVVHLSGVLGLDVLDAASAHGCPTGSFHPLKPLAAAVAPEWFVGITIGIEAAEASLLEHLAEIARMIGSRPRHVPDDQRPIYHAAAVMASAAVVALAAEASELLRILGWTQRESLDAIVPLMQGAVTNLAGEGLPDALSGPWRRGDVGTVERHLLALRGTGLSDVLAAYVAHGRGALRLAADLGLDDASRLRLEALLDRVD